MAIKHMRHFGQHQDRLTRNLARNPVANAIAMTEGIARIGEYKRNILIAVYVAVPGQDATALLSKLGWLLGLAAESERAGAGLTQRMRLLHGALRTVQLACLQGYTWPHTNITRAIDASIQHAVDALTAHPQHALAMMPGADHFEHQILTHKVNAESIAGAELYQVEGH
jgi:hypothetical protein